MPEIIWRSVGARNYPVPGGDYSRTTTEVHSGSLRTFFLAAKNPALCERLNWPYGDPGGWSEVFRAETFCESIASTDASKRHRRARPENLSFDRTAGRPQAASRLSSAENSYRKSKYQQAVPQAVNYIAAHRLTRLRLGWVPIRFGLLDAARFTANQPPVYQSGAVAAHLRGNTTPPRPSSRP
jgi:hypothetical protein